MSNQPSGKAVFLVLLVGVLGFGALAAYVKSSPRAQRVPDELRKASPDQSQPARPGRRTDEQTRHARQAPRYQIASLVGENVQLTGAPVKVPSGADAKLQLINATLRALEIADGAKALGVSLENHVAVISFNEAFVNRGYGSMEEANLIKAVQMVLGQFPDVQKVRFMQEGQPIASIGEHFDLNADLPVIRPGQDSPSTPSEG